MIYIIPASLATVHILPLISFSYVRDYSRPLKSFSFSSFKIFYVIFPPLCNISFYSSYPVWQRVCMIVSPRVTKCRKLLFFSKSNWSNVIKRVQSQQGLKMTSAPVKDSVQHAHPRSLIRAFAGRSLGSQWPKKAKNDLTALLSRWSEFPLHADVF